MVRCVREMFVYVVLQIMDRGFTIFLSTRKGIGLSRVPSIYVPMRYALHNVFPIIDYCQLARDIITIIIISKSKNYSERQRIVVGIWDNTLTTRT